MLNVSEQVFNALVEIVPNKKYAEWLDFVYPMHLKDHPEWADMGYVNYVRATTKHLCYYHNMLRGSLKKSEHDIAGFASLSDFWHVMMDYVDFEACDAKDKNWRRIEAESSDNELILYKDNDWIIGVPLTRKCKVLELHEASENAALEDLIFIVEARGELSIRFKNQKTIQDSFSFNMDWMLPQIGKHTITHLNRGSFNVRMNDESAFDRALEIMGAAYGNLLHVLFAAIDRLVEYWEDHVYEKLIPDFFKKLSYTYGAGVKIVGKPAIDSACVSFKLPTNVDTYNKSSIGKLLDILLTRAQVTEFGKKIFKAFVTWNDKNLNNCSIGIDSLNTAESYMGAEVKDSIADMLIEDPTASEDIRDAEDAALENELFYIIKELRADMYASLLEGIGFTYQSSAGTIEYDLSNLNFYDNDVFCVLLDLFEAPHNFNLVLEDWANEDAFVVKPLEKLSTIKLAKLVVADRFNRFLKSELN